MGSKIINWIKSNLTVVICGSLALISLVLIVLGFVLPEAQASLTADKSVYDGLQSVGGKAANERVIEDLRRKQNDLRRNIQAFLASAAKSTPRTLLHQDVFPDAKVRFDRAQFKSAVASKRLELLTLLNAKDQPEDDDVADYRERVQKAKLREKLEEGGTPADAALAMPTIGNTPGSSMPPGMGRDGVGYVGTGMAATAMPENITPEEWVKQDDRAGASIERAQQISCYGSELSLDLKSLIPPDDRYPSAEVMWEAQLSLWIQEDIIQVLAKLNNEVASQLPEEQRWVAHLPVKHLLYIAIGNYLSKAIAEPVMGGSGMGGGSGAVAIAVAEPAPPVSSGLFTKRQASETLDVVPLAVGLVIDANYLLRLLDDIGKSGFYTVLNVSYEAVPYDPTLRGYIYGPAPVIRVRLELENCILRDKLAIGDKKYVDLMPETIKNGTYVSQVRSGGPGPGGPPFGGPPFGGPPRGAPFGPPGGGRFRGEEP